MSLAVEIQKKKPLLDQAIPRVDALEKVTGSAVFTPDMELPNMLHGAVLKSPHPHARILSIDTSKAEQLPGVCAVVIGREMPNQFGEMLQDKPTLALGTTRYVGEPVAAVAAISKRIAEEALDLIKVSYDQLPAVFNPVEAMKEGAPIIHMHLGEYKKGSKGSFVKVVPDTNICNVGGVERGDIRQGFDESDYVFEDTFTTPPIVHAMLEPHCSIAKVDPDGAITLWASCDSPYRLQEELANVLGIERSRIRIIVSYIGGAFGGRMGTKTEHIAIALARKVIGRPVKLAYTREEVFTSTTTGHSSVTTVKTGVRKDGTLLARYVKCVLNAGPYAGRGPAVLLFSCMSGIGPYKIPNVKIEGYLVYTNTIPGDAFRGYGNFQTNFAVESQMDIIAQKLGTSPLTLRLKNIVKDGDTIAWNAQKVTSCGLEECIVKAANAIDWEKKEGVGIGKGLACGSMHTRLGSSSAVSLMLSWDGALTVYTSLTEQGQGSKHILTKLAASELGIPIAKIKVVTSDTEITPFDTCTAASRTVFHQGNALLNGISNLTDQLKAKLAAQHNVLPERVVFKESEFVVVGQTIEFLEAAKKTMKMGEQILAYGWYTPPPDSSVFWMYGAYGVTLKVDLRTGQIRVLKIAIAQDVGKAMDRTLTELQMVGGAVQGMGNTIYEELKFDEKGKILNPNFRDFAIPSSTDIPEVIPIIVETPNLEGPKGAKGVGEFPLTPVQAAIANAIYDATGKRFKEYPITPEKIALMK